MASTAYHEHAGSTRVELRVSARKLLNKDLLSKSDPICILYTTLADGKLIEIGRTEQINDNLNPKWIKPLMTPFDFHRKTILLFKIYDIDNESVVLNDHDFLGLVQIPLDEIVGARGQTATRPLSIPGKGSAGILIIQAEELRECSMCLSMVMYGKGLDALDSWISGGKSDPYLNFCKQREDGTWVVVHRTEVIKKSVTPRWKEISVSLSTLVNGDLGRTVRVECWDWDSTSKSDFIGMFETTVSGLSDSPPGGFQLINAAKKAKNKKYKNSGVIFVSNASSRKVPTFMEYLRGGLEVSLMVGIDFTSSNGDPRFPQSLHHTSPEFLNEYESAIHAVGSILASYDHDQMFPVWGFGGFFQHLQQTLHCFNVNNEASPDVFTVNGILQAYRNCLLNLKLSGPTNFSEIIDAAAMMAQRGAQDPYTQKYYILLMITDGVITDLDNTIDCLARAGGLPLSVVIVGVGDADFSAMSRLDGDKVRLKDKDGNPSVRDIVQFVEYRRFAGIPAMLADETLAEIPSQVMAYFESKGIKPKKSVVPALLRQNSGAGAPILLAAMAESNLPPTPPPLPGNYVGGGYQTPPPLLGGGSINNMAGMGGMLPPVPRPGGGERQISRGSPGLPGVKNTSPQLGIGDRQISRGSPGLGDRQMSRGSPGLPNSPLRISTGAGNQFGMGERQLSRGSPSLPNSPVRISTGGGNQPFRGVPPTPSSLRDPYGGGVPAFEIRTDSPSCSSKCADAYADDPYGP